MKQRVRSKGKTKTRNKLTMTSRGVPVEELNLTAEERALLEDPNYVTEDEADMIVVRRQQAREGDRGIPFREYLKKHGYKVER